MSNSEQSAQPFPVSDDIIVKLPKDTRIYFMQNNVYIFDAISCPIYTTAREFVKKSEHPILKNSIGPDSIFGQGIKVEILEPGKQWTSGKFRCRLVFEFVPDEQENNKIPSEPISPLDDLRKMNL